MAALDVEAAVEQLDEAVVVLEETSDGYGLVRAELTYAIVLGDVGYRADSAIHTSSVLSEATVSQASTASPMSWRSRWR